MKFKNISVKKANEFDLQRRVVSYMTSASWKHTPHVSYIYEPDITDFYNEFMKLAEKRNGLCNKISFNTIMIKVIAEGLLCAPDLNSYINYNYNKTTGKVYILDEINISIPWLLPDGRMITPTIPDAGKMPLNDISNYILNISRKIKNTNIDEMLYRTVVADTVNEIKKLNLSILRRVWAAKISRHRVKGLHGKVKKEYYKIPEKDRLTEKDIMSGTVTFSNIGSLYKEQKGFLGLLEIIPPQIFAVGLGPVQEKPGVYLSRNGDKQIGIRKFLPMSLVFDHRAVDFSSIVPFLKRLDEIFARPTVIHKW